jgi:hypothetical protein
LLPGGSEGVTNIGDEVFQLAHAAFVAYLLLEPLQTTEVAGGNPLCLFPWHPCADVSLDFLVQMKAEFLIEFPLCAIPLEESGKPLFETVYPSHDLASIRDLDDAVDRG